MLTTQNSRVYWSCRRGMLELDLILIPFYQNCYLELSNELQEQFRLLLESTDMELHAWLSGREIPSQTEIQSIVSLIRHYAADPSRPRDL